MHMTDPVYYSFVNINRDAYEEIWNYYPQLIGKSESWLPVTYSNIITNRYLVSAYGRIFDLVSNKIKPQFITNCGYLRVNLNNTDRNRRAYSVHRIVMAAFEPIMNMDSMQVNHKDEIKTHNWYWNLEWLTCSENRLYSIESGLIKARGQDNYNASITDEQADKIGYLIANTNMTYNEISKYLGVPKKVVDNIANGNAWLHVCAKYKLDEIYRNPPAATDEQIHKICQIIQDYKTSNSIGFGKRNDFYRYVATVAGLDPSSSAIIRLIERLYYKLTHKNICSQYDY